jgi:hypothetical protein
MAKGSEGQHSAERSMDPGPTDGGQPAEHYHLIVQEPGFSLFDERIFGGRN